MEFKELFNEVKKENHENKVRLKHNMKTKKIKNLLPFTNEAFLCLANFISEGLIRGGQS